MQFETVIETSGKTALGFRIPPEVVEGLGRGKRPAVLVTINGHTYRSTVAVMGGAFMIGVSAENRIPAGVSGGETVIVDLELDTAPRRVEVPADLRAELDQDGDARSRFEALSYSAQQRHVLPIEGAKTPETRARRIAKTMAALRE